MNLPPMKSFLVDRLKVRIHEDRMQTAADAATFISSQIQQLQLSQEEVNIVFAAAPSQLELLANLCQRGEFDWSRVNAFHMDEYVGLGSKDPNSFGHYLHAHLFRQVPLHSVHYMDGKNSDLENSCDEYSR